MSSFANYRRALIALCERRGWTVEQGSKHYRLCRPDVLGHITASITPNSEYRTLRNTETLLRRAEKTKNCNALKGDQAA